MREILKIITKVDMENIYIVINMFMKENIKKERYMEKENIHI